MAGFQQSGYLGFFMDVTIYDNAASGDQRVYHLRQKNPDTGEGGFPFLTGVSIVRALAEEGDVNTVTISIEAPFEAGREMLNSTMFYTQNTVVVKIGYIDGPILDDIYGFIKDGGVGLELTPDGISGSITATPLSKSAFYKDTGLKDKSDGKSFEDNIRLRAEMMGYQINFDGVSGDAFEKASKIARIRSLRSDGVPYGNLEAVQEMARSLNLSFEITMGQELVGGVPSSNQVPELRFFDAVALSEEPARRNFVMRGQFDQETSTYPIISYSPELSPGLFAMGGDGSAGNVKGAKIADDGTCRVEEALPVQSEVSGSRTTEKGTEGEPQDLEAEGPFSVKVLVDAALSVTGMGGFRMLTPEADSESDKNELRTYQDIRWAEEHAYPVNITLPGIPDLRAGETVKVTGLGALFDHNHFVLEVTHNLTAGSFETTAKCNSVPPLSNDLVNETNETDAADNS